MADCDDNELSWQLGYIITASDSYDGELIYLRRDRATEQLIDRLTVDLQYGPSRLRLQKVAFTRSAIFPERVKFLDERQHAYARVVAQIDFPKAE